MNSRASSEWGLASDTGRVGLTFAIGKAGLTSDTGRVGLTYAIGKAGLTSDTGRAGLTYAIGKAGLTSATGRVVFIKMRSKPEKQKREMAYCLLGAQL